MHMEVMSQVLAQVLTPVLTALQPRSRAPMPKAEQE